MGELGNTMVFSGAKPAKLGYRILAFLPTYPEKPVDIIYQE
jgi:hypothetical protein